MSCIDEYLLLDIIKMVEHRARAGREALLNMWLQKCRASLYGGLTLSDLHQLQGTTGGNGGICGNVRISRDVGMLE